MILMVTSLLLGGKVTWWFPERRDNDVALRKSKEIWLNTGLFFSQQQDAGEMRQYYGGRKIVFDNGC
jgi:hypothetical protein